MAFLGLLFAFSSIAKVRALIQAETASFVSVLPGPIRLREPLAFVVVMMEAVISVLLLLGRFEGLLLAGIILILYTGYIFTLPRETSCNCFAGAFEFGGSLGALAVRNLVLIALVLTGVILALLRRRVETSLTDLAIGGVMLLFAYCVDAFLQTSQDMVLAQRRRGSR